jgi:hypothetical protein
MKIKENYRVVSLGEEWCGQEKRVLRPCRFPVSTEGLTVDPNIALREPSRIQKRVGRGAVDEEIPAPEHGPWIRSGRHVRKAERAYLPRQERQARCGPIATHGGFREETLAVDQPGAVVHSAHVFDKKRHGVPGWDGNSCRTRTSVRTSDFPLINKDLDSVMQRLGRKV